VAQLTAGGHHTCASLETGAVRCWGHGAHGRLGYGNTSDIGDDETPASAGDVPYR
jgi:alpha-tubulin suppressor-like RCC1 family protein